MSQLQTLIDVAFKMATGSVEALRPLGLKLLKVLQTLHFALGAVTLVAQSVYNHRAGTHGYYSLPH